MPECPNCQREVAAADAFCRHCGHNLRGPGDDRPADDRRTSFMDDMAARFQSRLKQQAGDVDALYNLALTLFHSQRYAEAIPRLREVVAALPDLADAWAKLAVALWQTDAREEAMEHMERAMALAPGDEQWRKLLQQMREHSRS